MHLLFPSMWFLSSEAGTGDDDDLSAVSEPIQASRGQERIAEQVRPFLRGPVTGEQDTAAFVPLIDDVVEVLGGGGVERFETEVVQDQQIGAEVGLEAALQGVVGATAVEILEHAIGVDEQSGVATPTGLVGQGLGQMSLDAPIDLPPLGRMLSATWMSTSTSRFSSSFQLHACAVGQPAVDHCGPDRHRLLDRA
jgi:hypothetical protein